MTRARDVPAIQDALITEERNTWDKAAHDMTQAAAETGNEAMAEEAAKLRTQIAEPNRTRWVAALRAAELFFVTAPMERLARDAIQTLPDYELHREDLPAQVGLLIWETRHPALEGDPDSEGFDNIGFLWRDAGTGVEVYEIRDLHRYVLLRKPEVFGMWRQTYPQYSYSKEYEIKYGDPIWPWTGSGHDISEIEFMLRMRATLVVVWLLMGQEIVTVGRHVPRSRAAIRRAARRELPSAVRTVTLRHSHYDPAEVEAQLEGAGRVYRHRWYVRGHWRRQWYPSRSEHRPLWIPAYIKGPDGAPLLTGSIVKVLSR